MTIRGMVKSVKILKQIHIVLARTLCCQRVEKKKDVEFEQAYKDQAVSKCCELESETAEKRRLLNHQ